MYAKELMFLNEDQSKSEVEKLLAEFDQDFHSPKVDELRENFPRYVALYTKFIFKPDIVVRGINPSLFSCRKADSFNEDKEVKRVASLKGLHNINAYIEYPEPLYHYYLTKDIEKITSKDFIRQNLMGWNDCFIQSPKQGGMDFLESKAKSIDKKNKNSFCIDLINKSKLIANKFEYLIRPKLLIYAGKDAASQARWGNRDSLNEMKKQIKKTIWGGKAIAVKHFSYPCSKRSEEISLALSIQGGK